MEAMLYFLLNSATLIGVLGLTFFLLGLWMGWLIWGVYRERTRLAEQASSGMRSRLNSAQAERQRLEARVRDLERQVEILSENHTPLQMDPDATPADADAELLRSQLEQTRSELLMEKGQNATLNADLSSTAARAELAERQLALARGERDLLRERLRDLSASDEDETERPVDETAPLQADDLTRIRGIGSVLQGTLNRHGIFRYEQIAAWGEADAEHFSQLLRFRDRIHRDDWIGQARELTRQQDATG